MTDTPAPEAPLGHPVDGTIAALVWLQLAGAAACALRVIGGVGFDPALTARVVPALREVCARAGCAVPRVALRDDAVRVGSVRNVKGRPVLTLAAPFVRVAGDGELRALLAHEVAHITAGDLAVQRRRGWAVAVLGGLTGFAWGFFVKDPLAAPIWAAGFDVAVILLAALAAPSNRPREVRADAEGARLCGEPRDMAAALRLACALSEETRRRRYPGAIRILLAPVIWRLPTHPPLAERVDRLEALPTPPA